MPALLLNYYGNPLDFTWAFINLNFNLSLGKGVIRKELLLRKGKVKEFVPGDNHLTTVYTNYRFRLLFKIYVQYFIRTRTLWIFPNCMYGLCGGICTRKCQHHTLYCSNTATAHKLLIVFILWEQVAIVLLSVLACRKQYS